MHPKALRSILLAFLLVPFFLGMFGTGMHFIPSQSFRWAALLIAVIYCALLFAGLLKLRRRREPDMTEKIPASVKLVAGFAVMVYFLYVFFYMNLPAAYTQVFGTLTQREYQIEGVKRGGAKAVLCRYRLKLRAVPTVLNDTFCVGEEFARSHSSGQSIVLTGKETAFGLRFDNAS